MKPLPIILLLTLLLAACTTAPAPTPPPSPTISPTTPPSPSPSHTPTITSISTKTPTPSATPTPTMIVKPVDSFCVWPPTQIADVEVRNFIWSDDNLNLIYKEKGGEWYIYTISSGETREYILDSEITEPPEAFGIQSYYHFFISPDGKSVVYTIVNQDGFSIYLKNLDEEDPIFLGDIKGWIEKYEWLNDGTRLILSINWLMKLGAPEAYVYMVDIIEKKVNVIIPSSSEYRDISYFGITPDDSKLLFVTYSGPDRSLRLWDMTDDSVIVTKIHQTLTFKWLPNSQEFVAAGYQNESL
jgi:Tol biopolymer transport system component